LSISRTIVIASRNRCERTIGAQSMRSVAAAMRIRSLIVPGPAPVRRARAISIAIRVGWRLWGLNTPMPMPSLLVAAAHVDAAGSTPRLNAFSANQTESKP